MRLAPSIWPEGYVLIKICILSLKYWDSCCLYHCIIGIMKLWIEYLYIICSVIIKSECWNYWAIERNHDTQIYIEPASQYYNLGSLAKTWDVAASFSKRCSHHLTSIEIMHFHFWYALINSCHSSAAKQSIHDYMSLPMKDPAHITDTQRHECM